MSIINEEIRELQKNDKFFLEEGHPDEIAWLHKNFQELSIYADSYQTAVLTLIDSALSDRNLRDHSIYPAVFLIRHYLELRLKGLIQELNYSKEQNKNFPSHHYLQNLWSDFKTAYKSIGKDINNDSFQVMGELIKEMSSVDPASMSFRYPIDKQGKKTQKLEYVNLTNLRETFVRACFFLDGMAMQMEHYRELSEEA